MSGPLVMMKLNLKNSTRLSPRIVHASWKLLSVSRLMWIHLELSTTYHVLDTKFPQLSTNYFSSEFSWIDQGIVPCVYVFLYSYETLSIRLKIIPDQEICFYKVCYNFFLHISHQDILYNYIFKYFLEYYLLSTEK